MSKELKQSAALMRKLLASIDLSDIEELRKQEEKMKDGEVLNRAGDAEIFYKNHFERVLKILIRKQLEARIMNAGDDDTLQFTRGTINGFFLIKEWFEDETKLSLSRFDKSDEEEDIQDKVSPLPKI